VSREQENKLREEIQQLISGKYASIDPVRVSILLEALSVEFEEVARNERSKPPVGYASTPGSRVAASNNKRPGGNADASSSVDFLEISIVAVDEHQVASLLNQIVNVGALMMEVDSPVKLNEFVTLAIEYEPLQFSMEITGRVVNISSRGTAIEVMKLEREDRAALESLYQDYQHLLHDGSASNSQDEASEPSRAPASNAPAAAPAASTRSTREGTPARSAVSRTSEGPMARLGSTLDSARFTVRRQVAITKPDEQVANIAAMNEPENKPDQGKAQKREEFYGPQTHWIEPQGDPDRIEQLTDERILDIFLQLSGHAFSGMLQLRQAPEKKGGEELIWQLLFDSGFLVEASRRPRAPRIELGHMLLLANRIKKEDLSIAAAHADEHLLPIERGLLELDLLEPNALRQSLAGRLTFVLRRLCSVTKGTVEIYSEESLPAGYLPTPPLRVHVAIERTVFQLLFEQLRQLSVREREKQAYAELDAYPESGPEEVDRVERALTNEDHLKFIRRLATGRRRLREVITESPLSGSDTFAILFALHRMGLLRFDRSLHHTVVRERYRENVTVKYLSVHKASYFEVLNVHWSSYDEVIERAYSELVQQFDPSQVPENLEKEVHQRVSDIRERIESAYQVLARREHRHAYRTRIMPEYKLAHAIPLFLKQCELAQRRNQIEEACDSLKRVLELDPNHETARAQLAGFEQRLKGDLAENSSSMPI
jgi:hypothetical protein